jgi:hypothetical protein
VTAATVAGVVVVVFFVWLAVASVFGVVIGNAIRDNDDDSWDDDWDDTE